MNGVLYYHYTISEFEEQQSKGDSIRLRILDWIISVG